MKALMRQKAKVHTIPRNTRNTSDPMAMLVNGDHPPQHQKGSSRPGSVMSSGHSIVSSTEGNRKMGQEIMVDSSKKSALDLLKLLGLIVPQLLALTFVSALLITESVDVMRHSRDLKQHVQWMEPIRLVITQLQREREMTCVLISTDR